jgi:hypothetical protein
MCNHAIRLGKNQEKKKNDKKKSFIKKIGGQ